MHYNVYGQYKDSNIDWIKLIPNHWMPYKLKHVVNEFIAGGTPKSSNDSFWDENNNGIPWVAIGDMNDNDYVNSTAKSITREGLASKNLRILKKGTLIYSIFASLGKTSILNIDATTNQAILGLILSNNIDNIYLKYYLVALQTTISSFSNENTQENLNSNIVKNMEIAIPINLEEQQQIANYLDKKTDKIEETIAKNKQLIELLEEKRTALINQVVTKGLNPNVLMKDSGVEWIGEIPEHWEITKVKHELDILDHKRVPLSAEVRSDMDRIYDYYGASGIIDKVDSYLFDGKYILVGEDGANLLSRSTPLAFIAEGKFWVNNHAHILSPKYGNNIDYFVSLLEATDYTPFIEGSAQPKLTADNLKNIILIKPPLLEQNEIAIFLNSQLTHIHETLSKIKNNINLLEEYKTSLIHHVVTGKIDVRGEEI